MGTVTHQLWESVQESVRALVTSRQSVLHLSEWNQGGSLWVVSFLAVGRQTKDVIFHAMKSLSDKADTAYALRRSPSGEVRKVNRYNLANDGEALSRRGYTGSKVAPGTPDRA